jgi:hypothetical protein
MLIDLTQQQSLLLIRQIAALAMIVTSLEYLAAQRVLTDGGIMSWPIGSLQRSWLADGFLRVFLDKLLKYPNVIALIVIRSALALAILCGFDNPILFYGVTLLSILFLMRSPYGHDGADQMLLIIFTALSLVALVDTHLTRTCLLWFLAFQGCLAYSVAGFAKLSARGWRDGSYLIAICGTSIYGNYKLARLFHKRPRLSVLVSRALICWECTFPIVLIAPPLVSYSLLAMGVVFHSINAYVMGLNIFFFAFLATYPAILMCMQSRIFN